MIYRFKARYKHRRSDILDFARLKLCNGLDNYTEDTFIAAIASRVMAEFPLHHVNIGNINRVRELDATLVASHMRIVYSIPKHREYMRTGYSSEPLLADAAARVMHDKPEETWKGFVTCLQNELISKGERGEAILRFLSIRGFDVTRAWDGKEQFAKPIRLLDFLKTLFGDVNYDQIKKCSAHNIVEGGVPLEEAFKDAYVCFSHYVRGGDASIISDLCALVALSRGMAWQCYPEQAGIDIVLPVAFLQSLDEPLTRSKITFLAFQVKNRKEVRPVIVDMEYFFTSEGEERPYIVVVVELGVKIDGPRVMLKSPPTVGHYSRGRPRYFFTVYGCDSKSFGVIKPHNERVFDALLNSDDLFDDHPRKEDFVEAVREMAPVWTSKLCRVKLIKAPVENQ